MFDFPCVIEVGTVDEFKDCVIAVVYLPPPPRPTIRKLKHGWTQEIHQDLVAMYSISAEAVLVQSVQQALQTEQTLRERGMRIDDAALAQIAGRMRRPRRIRMRLTSR